MPDSNGWNSSSTSSGWNSSDSDCRKKETTGEWKSKKTDSKGFTVGVSKEVDRNKIEIEGKLGNNKKTKD